MNSLSPCESREEFPGGGDRFHCIHPLVHSKDSVVSRGVCRTCRYAGAEAHRTSAGQRQERERCAFLGEETDAATATFQCLHPCHQQVTSADCRDCIDHVTNYRTEGVVRTWAVGMTTAPRGITTLGQTLESLESGGWSEVSIFAEPDAPKEGLKAGHRWIPRCEKLGAFPNWYLSLTELVMRYPHVDAYMMCQDDVLFSEHMRGYLEHNLWPAHGAHVTSLYCAEKDEQAGREGFVKLDAGWSMCGALALVLPNAVARALLCDSLFFHHRQNGPRDGMASIDSVIGLWCQRSQIPFFVHQPTLAKHIGEHSSLWGYLNPSPRRSASTEPMVLKPPTLVKASSPASVTATLLPDAMRNTLEAGQKKGVPVSPYY